MPQFVEIARQLLAFLHVRARFGQPGFFASLRFERRQFGKMGQQEVLIGLRGIDRLARLGQCVFGGAPFRPCRCHTPGITARKPVQQGPVTARVHEAAIVVLAVQFDEISGHFPQQSDTGRLIVDEGFALPIRLDLATHDQRLTFLEFNVGIVQQLHQTARQAVEFETGRNAGLVLSAPNQPAIRAISQHQTKRVEQDRFACPGFARQHAQPPTKGEIERLDKDDVADG